MTVIAVFDQCLDAVVTVLKSLDLDGIPQANISRRETTTSDIGSYPSIQVVPGAPETMDPNAGTNQRDDVVYSILVALYDAPNQDQNAGRSRRLRWREQIARAFRNQRLTGVDEVYRCIVTPQQVFDQGRFIGSNIYMAGLMLRFTSREARGT